MYKELPLIDTFAAIAVYKVWQGTFQPQAVQIQKHNWQTLHTGMKMLPRRILSLVPLY